MLVCRYLRSCRIRRKVEKEKGNKKIKHGQLLHGGQQEQRNRSIKRNQQNCKHLFSSSSFLHGSSNVRPFLSREFMEIDQNGGEKEIRRAKKKRREDKNTGFRELARPHRGSRLPLFSGARMDFSFSKKLHT